ncbi:hypothetical protein [Amycolatopsis sp. PS_44_ISF1]|uniref:hypothetical protein n=1 Tax=Amycolatopsis sp. PS_44_ISF1 TaxID=2974917 RepID=UPI0028DDA748|nr:hypothetical protein [Amycolatopsis sp. PS_44_ISF1]MDT8916217.1 hypothetical protein [Amycolatopsis sp. PS_44_ISF1]
MRLDEVEATRAQVYREWQWLRDDLDAGREVRADEERAIDAAVAAFEREAAAHRGEQLAIEAGDEPVVYGPLTLESLQLQHDGEQVCPECGPRADGLRLFARGDAGHRAWMSCADGHEWESADLTYDFVRRTLATMSAAREIDVRTGTSRTEPVEVPRGSPARDYEPGSM